MRSEELLGALEECGALERGHFLLSSGLHSPAYVQCARYLENPERARRAGAAIAAALADLDIEADSVLSPALGGVIIGHEVAAALGVPFRFAERQGSALVLRRGFALRRGERVVIVEDVVTTGMSTLETAALAAAQGAEVVAVGSLIDRSGGHHGFGMPFAHLLQLELPTWSEGSCPLCAEGSVAVKPGSRPQSEST